MTESNLCTVFVTVTSCMPVAFRQYRESRLHRDSIGRADYTGQYRESRLHRTV